MPDPEPDWGGSIKSFADSLEEFLAEVEAGAERLFRADEVERAEEAISWPARFLADDPLARDAVWLMALSHGLGVSIEGKLRARRRRADALVAVRSQSTPDIIRIYEEEARDIAARIAGEARSAMAEPLSPDDLDRLRTAKYRALLRRAHGRKRLSILKGGAAAVPLSDDELTAALVARNRRIEVGARMRFRRDAKSANVVERETVVRRQDVMPGRHFNERPMRACFERAIARIADTLNGA